MITRGYICDACDHAFEVQQPMHEDKLKICPSCECETLYQDLRGQYHSIIGQPSTLGHLAERNTQKMGQYEFQMKEEGLRQKKLKKNQKRLKEAGHDIPLEKCEHKPWYGTVDKKTATDLNKMTPAQKVNYIKNG